MVWLTGGAIIICIAMILGLLTLVLWNGLPTFWPAPLVRIARVDGKVLLGEETRSETFQLSEDTLRHLSNEEVAAGKAYLKKSDRSPVRRRLLRTGNFELTSEHFQLVSDFAIQPKGESFPTWAITIERMEWGRFYGEPRRFTRRYPRTPTVEEEELVEIHQFLESQRSRLKPEETSKFDEATAPVSKALEAARAKSTADFLSHFKPEDNREIVLKLADGQSIPFASYTSGQNVTEIRETWLEPSLAWQNFTRYHGEVRRRSLEKYNLEQHEIGRVNTRMEDARLKLRGKELDFGVAAVDLAAELKTAESGIKAVQDTIDQLDATIAKLKSHFSNQPALLQFATQFATAQRNEIAVQLQDTEQTRDRLRATLQQLPERVFREVERFIAIHLAAEPETVAIQKQISMLNDENNRYELTMVTADGQDQPLKLADIVRAYPANQLSLAGKMGVYFSRWYEFLADQPREANSEGGVFPAIWGTVVMTLVMSMLVVPFGVLAALYLREYARAGIVVSAIRISISNLAGVPSIVFGVFGLGFFCYVFGSFIDGGPRNAGLTPLPPRAWWLVLMALSICSVVAFSCGLASLAGRRNENSRIRQWAGYGAIVLWLATLVMAAALLFGSPYFHGFFAAELPNPTFGKGGLIWASLTLALLTLPVVIVATEEALSAVPNSLREGSYACGASKWQTIRRIVLPHAMPGIMTGMILAMARGAGEAAPLMLVGAVKLAPDLPVDTTFPFLHLDRSFMHLGFHIFDVGFQSRNSEAGKPMVFVTTILLITLVATMNAAAIIIRNRLKKRFVGSQF
jgi:phosphate transport system permease protein